MSTASAGRAGSAANALARLRQDYAPVFLRYLSQRDEVGLRAAYELGRRAMRDQISMLDLAQVHHGHLLEALKTARADADLQDLALGASEFFVEVLAPFEMTHRAFAERSPARDGTSQ